MSRSKLEIQIDVLKVLARHGPLKPTHIMFKANLNCGVLKKHLKFLIQHDLVEKQTLPKKSVVYAVTQRGLTVLQCFRNLNSALRTIEETNKIPALLY